jgi:hypothetical protein
MVHTKVEVALFIPAPSLQFSRIKKLFVATQVIRFTVRRFPMKSGLIAL